MDRDEINRSGSSANLRPSPHSWARTARSSLASLFGGVPLCDGKTHGQSPTLLDEESQHRDFTYRGKMTGLRIGLMILIAVVTFVTAFLTWYFTTLYTTKSIASLAYNLRIQLLQRPLNRMWNLLNSTLDTTMVQVNLAEYVVGQYSLPIIPEQQSQLYSTMRNITWAVFTSRITIKSVMVVYTNGEVQAFDRNEKTNQTSYYFSLPANMTSPGLLGSSSTGGVVAEAPESIFPPVPSQPDGAGTKFLSIWYRQQVDPLSGQPTGPAIQVPSNDLSGDILESCQFHGGQAFWHMKVSDFDDTPLLVSGSPVRHPTTGTVLAVVGVTSALSSINQLMETLTSMDSGYMYLTTEHGYVLATSTSSPLLKNMTNGQNLMKAEDSIDPIIRDSAIWLRENYGEPMLSQNEVHAENIRLQGEKFYIDSFFLNLTKLPLVGVIVMPRSYVMGQVDHMGHTTLIILAVGILSLLAVACALSQLLTRGVSMEMKLRAELIHHLDARRRAEASSNYKSQFLANMSHELRTPMAAVIGLLDILLCDEYLTGEQVAMVSQIRRCSNALLRLLNNILDLSKVESGKLVLEEADFDIGRELEGLVDVFSVQCMDHNLEIMLDLADDMPKMVQGDSARVVQIFANLIANAIKFTSMGHILIRAWCEPSPTSFQKGLSRRENPVWHLAKTCESSPTLFQKGLSRREKPVWHAAKASTGIGTCSSRFQQTEKITLWFEVEDTGCGIDSSKWETVFDSFVQADPSTTRTYGGTGLGLCIVRSLVNKMGGEIKVVRKEGPGTLLRLSLLFGQPSEGTVASGRFSTSNCLTCPFEPEQSSVLLVMKDGISRMTLSKWLTSKGSQVYEMSDLLKATKLLQLMVHHERLDGSENFWRFRAEGDSLGNVDKSSGRNFCSLDRYGKQDILQDTVTSDDIRDAVLQVDLDTRALRPLRFFSVIDVGLLDSNTDTWRSQLLSLHNIGKQGVTVGWLLNYNTPSIIKMEIRKMGFLMMVNKPLYKSKFLQLFSPMSGEGSMDKSTPEKIPTQHCVGFQLDVRDGLSPGSNMILTLEKSCDNDPNLSFNSNLEAVNCLEAGKAFRTSSICGSNEVLESNLEPQSCPDKLDGQPSSQTKQLDNSDYKHMPVLYINSPQNPLICANSTKNVLISESLEFLEIPENDIDRGSPRNHEKINSEKFIDSAQTRQFTDNGIGECHQCKSPAEALFSDQSEPDLVEIQSTSESCGILTTERKEQSWYTGVSYKKEILEDSVNRFLNPSNPVTHSSLTASSPVLSMNGLNQPLSNHFSCLSGNMHPVKYEEASADPRDLLPVPVPVPAPAPKNPWVKQNALKGLRILLAEDTPVLQRVATIMLQKMGASVVAVGDGQQAVDVLTSAHRLSSPTCSGNLNSDSQSSQFDLVLMDCQMPRMDGYDATKAIRKAEEGTDWRTPIVALTAHAMSSDEAKCLQVGMDAYLTKPIDSKLLVSTILTLTTRKRE